MSKTASCLNRCGNLIHDMSIPGWVASPHNVEKVRRRIVEEKLEPNIPVVLEVLSNSVYRYVDFDGSLAMPRKTQ